MDGPFHDSPATEQLAATRRTRVPVTDIAVHLAEQREAVLRHLLFWLQDQTYFRQRWHSQLAEMPVFEVEALARLQQLLIEISDASEQYPFGFDPEDEGIAQRLSSRLRMLHHEVLHLQKLCGAYISRTCEPRVSQ